MGDVFVSAEDIPPELAEYFEPVDFRVRRSVLQFGIQSFPEAHFATFPEALVEPMILAGTSARGACPECGKAWERIVRRTRHINKREPAHVPHNSSTKTDSTGWKPTSVATSPWQPTCDCDASDPVSQTVLDPFAGAGTTGIVACRLGRRFVGVELNPEYVEMARRRYDKTYEVEVRANGQSVVFEQTRLIG